MGKTLRTEHKEKQSNWEISMRPETFPQILSIGIWAPQEASTPLLQELERANSTTISQDGELASMMHSH